MASAEFPILPCHFSLPGGGFTNQVWIYKQQFFANSSGLCVKNCGPGHFGNKTTDRCQGEEGFRKNNSRYSPSACSTTCPKDQYIARNCSTAADICQRKSCLSCCC